MIWLTLNINQCQGKVLFTSDMPTLISNVRHGSISHLWSTSQQCTRLADVVSCVHPGVVLNATFCMTCSFLMLVDNALRCTQCSILLHLMDICFLPCICLWQISQNPDLFVCSCRTWICLTFMWSSGSAWPSCLKNCKYDPIVWYESFSTHFAHQFVTAVTAPPLVDCVVWCHSFFRGVNEEYWSREFMTGCPSWHQPCAWDAASNNLICYYMLTIIYRLR